MAFKMNGWQAHSTSPMKRGEFWGKVKSKAKKAWETGKETLQTVRDKSVNMSNFAGMGKDWKNQQDAYEKRKTDLRQKALNKDISFEEYKTAMENPKKSPMNNYKKGYYKK